MITPAQIRAARALIGAKQSELAKAAGISLATLNNIERGVGDPRTSTLEAIEAALGRAGVTLGGDAEHVSVCLSTVARPRAYDTLLASARVLETLGPGSLTKPELVVFFARWSQGGERRGAHARAVSGEAFGEASGEVVGGASGAAVGDSRPRICVLVEGRSRAVLFDEVDFTLGSVGRVAEVAGLMLAAFAYHRSRLRYIEDILDDTTQADAVETILRLRALGGRPLTHPRQFFDVVDDWEGRLEAYAGRKGHPMADLIAFFRRTAPAEV